MNLRERSGWDSNPRGLAPSGFQDRRDQPDSATAPVEVPPGIEPGTAGLQPAASPIGIGTTSARRGLNPRPSAWEADALPTELHAQVRPAGLEPANPRGRSLLGRECLPIPPRTRTEGAGVEPAGPFGSLLSRQVRLAEMRLPSNKCSRAGSNRHADCRPRLLRPGCLPIPARERHAHGRTRTATPLPEPRPLKPGRLPRFVTCAHILRPRPGSNREPAGPKPAALPVALRGFNNLGRGTRTPDLRDPNAARYRTAPPPATAWTRRGSNPGPSPYESAALPC